MIVIILIILTLVNVIWPLAFIKFVKSEMDLHKEAIMMLAEEVTKLYKKINKDETN